MEKELQTFQIADFALQSDFNKINPQIVEQLKRHLLDSLGSMFYATIKPSIQKMVRQMQVIEQGGPCRVPILGSLSYDRAAQLYTALIRYPDFMDNFMGKESTCHPSDNIGALLAASQCIPTQGNDFLNAMAISYQVECRLIEEIPVMIEGIDHTALLSYSIVSGLIKLLSLNKDQAAHALGIAGSLISPLVTSRASYTYEWKGFASSMVALNCVNIVWLAQQGITGPIALFEGPKGFEEIFKMKLDYDWSQETFELIPKCVLKPYNAEVHSQSAIDAALELKRKESFNVEDIEKIEITTFLTSYHIIGSGAYGDRKIVHSKEQADHSLFYLIAVALIDGNVYPEQFEPERIERTDVQSLLQKVNVHTKFPIHKPVKIAGLLDPYTEAYPDKLKAKVEIQLYNGKKLISEKEDFPGFHTRPYGWEETIEKFKHLCKGVIPPSHQTEIINCVQDLENRNMNSLIDLLMI